MKTGDGKLQYWRDYYRQKQAQRLADQSPDSLELLSDVDVAYLAGLVDGEGCIGITLNPRKLHIPSVQLIMTAQPLLEWVAQKLNTTCKPLKRKLKPQHRPQFEVRLAGRRAVWFCMMIEPFLHEKQEQARIIIEFGDTYRTGYDAAGLPADIVAKRQALKERLHAIKSFVPRDQQESLVA